MGLTMDKIMPIRNHPLKSTVTLGLMLIVIFLQW